MPRSIENDFRRMARGTGGRVVQNALHGRAGCNARLSERGVAAHDWLG
jgi:hypothetical protein